MSLSFAAQSTTTSTILPLPTEQTTGLLITKRSFRPGLHEEMMGRM